MGEKATENKHYFVWQKINLLAFNPKGEKDIHSWISCYSKSLQSFWGLDNPISQDLFSLQVYNAEIPLSFNFTFNGTKDFAVKFYYPHNDENNFLWVHDVDDRNYYFPYNKIQIPENVDTNTIKDSEIKKVLDGLLFHPAIHQHIVEPEFPHSIRIGGGIYNPFQFLFHLRYQLCFIQENREEEKKRLLKLFSGAIANRIRSITPSELMGL
jgi:hypothetical protein